MFSLSPSTHGRMGVSRVEEKILGQNVTKYKPASSVKILHRQHQGCIICSILPSGIGARGVSSEHVENVEMFFLHLLMFR